MGPSSPFIGAVTAPTKDSDESKQKPKKHKKEKKRKKHKHHHHKHNKHHRHHHHHSDDNEDDLIQNSSTTTQKLPPPLQFPSPGAFNIPSEQAGSTKPSVPFHPGTFDEPENRPGGLFNVGTTKVQPDTANAAADAVKADHASIEPSAVAQLKTAKSGVSSHTKPRYQIKPDTKDDLEKLALSFDKNKDGIFSFLEVKQITTQYIHDLKLGKLKKKEGSTTACSKSTISVILIIATVLGIGVSLLGNYLGLMVSAPQLGFPMIVRSHRTPGNTVTEDRAFVSLRGPGGSMVTTSETRTILVQSFPELFALNASALNRMNGVTFLVESDQTPVSGFTLVSENVLGYSIKGTSGTLEIHTATGSLVLRDHGNTASFRPRDQRTPPVELPVLLPSALDSSLLQPSVTGVASAQSEARDGARCPAGMTASVRDDTSLLDCECPAGSGGSVWTGCVPGGRAHPPERCTSTRTRQVSSSRLCGELMSSAPEWFQSPRFPDICLATVLSGPDDCAAAPTADLSTAAATCAGKGARLCTQAELLGGALRGSLGQPGQCDLSASSAEVWTGTPCRDGYWAASADGSGSRCLAGGQAVAACCADLHPRCTDLQCAVSNSTEVGVVSNGECQLPFVYLDGDGRERLYASCPTLAEAPPAGAAALSLPATATWCPVRGTAVASVYSADVSLGGLNSGWGLCQASCGPRGNPLLSKPGASARSDSVSRRCVASATLREAKTFCDLLDADLCEESELRSILHLFQQDGTPERVHGDVMMDLRCAVDARESNVGVQHAGIVTKTRCGEGDHEFVVMDIAEDNKSFRRTCVAFTEQMTRGVTCCKRSQDYSGLQGGISFNMDSL